MKLNVKEIVLKSKSDVMGHIYTPSQEAEEKGMLSSKSSFATKV